MFFEIDRDSLTDALSKTFPITDKKSTLPILSHILVDVKETEVILKATDLSIGLTINYPCNVTEGGTITVPGKKAFEIARELPPGPVRIVLEQDGRIRLTAGLSVFDLAGLDASDYPVLPSFEDIQSTDISAEKIVMMIDKTVFASSTDESRFNLNGVLFEQAEEKIRLVATDGHRLALIDEDIGMEIPHKRVVVAKRSLTELRRMLEGLKEDVHLGFETKNMFVKTDRFLMSVRLTNGEYPDYRQVIPPKSDQFLMADRFRLLQALKRVSVLTSDRNRGVTVNIEPGTIEISVVHTDLGTARDALDVSYDGERLSFIVNAFYLMESLSAVDTDMVRMEFHSEGKPIILNPEPASNYFNLVMPMRK